MHQDVTISTSASKIDLLTSDPLLQGQSQPAQTSQFCTPSGSCELSNMHNGVLGFMVQGQAAYDLSGYSVSAAGDINGDGLGDMLVGAYGANPASGADAGKAYVVFGSKQTNAWGSGILDLSSLINGQRGFVLQGEAANDYSGFSVSGAGDINGDRFADILVGAYGADPAGRTDAGKTYVVFGSNQTNAWGSGVVNIISLMNGQRGFVLQGEVAGDNSGMSVSGGGDINGDRFADIVIGAPYADPGGLSAAGKTYVVFGSNQANIWGSGIVELSALMSTNGQRGFVLWGQAAVDRSGRSVSNTGGDINGDGLADIVIGAYQADPAGRTEAGNTYVVFGSNQANAWGDGIIKNLGGFLNGQRGFILEGEAVNDASGFSVSGGGDINGDNLDDILVGAFGADSAGQTDNGKTYVIFGSNQTNAWGSGELSLTSLMNGQRGFVLQGQMGGDYFGAAVNNVGDINGDGLEDILVGAYDADPDGRSQAGKTYAILGSRQSSNWGTGKLNVSSLINGQRGFVLQGEAAGDNSGISVSSAGDMNGDQLSDVLVGASKASPGGRTNAGKTYLIFGDAPPVIMNNTLLVYNAQVTLLNSNFLAAIDKNQANSSIVFIPSNVIHGRFATTIDPNIALANFTQQQVWQGNIQFIPDGSGFSPSYNITVRTSGNAWTGPAAANVTFIPVELINNQMQINQGQTLSINTNNLYAVGGSATSLIFQVSALQHGQFSLSIDPNQTILSFTQQNILDNQVIFIHDNSLTAPAYRVVVDNGIAMTLPSAANISFDTTPIIKINQLFLSQSQKIVLNSNNLLSEHNGVASSDLQYILQNINNGKVIRISQPNYAITTFSQQDVFTQQIAFIPDGSLLAPDFQVQVTDGIAYSEFSSTTGFLVSKNYLPVNQGESLLLISDYLNIDSNLFAPDQIRWNINSAVNGHFELQDNPGYEVVSFTQQQINEQSIVFIPDNSTNTPSCILVVTDGQNQFYGSLNANVDFDTPPWLINNQLTTYPGQAQKIDSALLLGGDAQTGSGNLIFYVSDAQHGYFAYVNQQHQNISQFWQQDVDAGSIAFVTDSSGMAPSYKITVSDGRMNCSDCPEAAKINFHPDGPPHSDGPFWSPIVTAAVAVGGAGFLLAALRAYIKYKLVPRYFENTRMRGTEAERDRRQNTILPIAKYIYDRVKFSYILGYSSEASVKDYVDAVSELVRELETLTGDVINIADMELSARSRLLDSIAIHTQKELVGEKACCSLKSMKGIITADSTPALLKAKAVAIANAVKDDRYSLEISAGGDEKAEGNVQFPLRLLGSSRSDLGSVRSSQAQQHSVPLLSLN